MRKLIKRIWSREDAAAYCRRVEEWRQKYGLKYLSACDYLRRAPVQK